MCLVLLTDRSAVYRPVETVCLLYGTLTTTTTVTLTMLLSVNINKVVCLSCGVSKDLDVL